MSRPITEAEADETALMVLAIIRDLRDEGHRIVTTDPPRRKVDSLGRVRHENQDRPPRDYDPAPWTADAACKGEPTDLFFPPRGRGSAYDVAQAKAICAACPVSAECLAYAYRNGERAGIWGGLTPNERRADLRDRRRQGQALGPGRVA